MQPLLSRCEPWTSGLLFPAPGVLSVSQGSSVPWAQWPTRRSQHTVAIVLETGVLMHRAQGEGTEQMQGPQPSGSTQSFGMHQLQHLAWPCQPGPIWALPESASWVGVLQGPSGLRPSNTRGAWKECPWRGHGLTLPRYLPWIPELLSASLSWAQFQGPQVSRRRGHPKESSVLKKAGRPFSGSICVAEQACQVRNQKAPAVKAAPSHPAGHQALLGLRACLSLPLTRTATVSFLLESVYAACCSRAFKGGVGGKAA